MVIAQFSSRGGVIARKPKPKSESTNDMLWTIAVVLFVLWALGLVTSYTVGGFIHLLLVLAVIAVVIRLIQGRPVA